MATKTVSLASSITRRFSPYRDFLLEAEVDFTNAAHTLAQNDLLEALAIPAKTFVKRIYWEVVTVEGAARNFAVGDGSDDDGFITTTSANSLANGISSIVLSADATPVVVGYSNGKYYAAADTIDVKAVTSGGLTTGKLKLRADCVDLS